jgi:ABC-2 type transport system permease protein
MKNLTLTMIKCSLKKELLYYNGFWNKSLFLIMGYFADILMIIILLSKIGTIAGWETSNITFMYGFNTLAYTLTATIFAFCANFSDEIVYGKYDSALVLPMNTIKYYILNGINLTYLSRAILCIGIIVLSLVYSNITITLGMIAYILISLIGAVLIQSAFFISFAIPNFFFIKSNNFRSIYMGIRFFCNYPLSIYPTGIQFFLTYICPLGFISYYPSLHIFRKLHPETHWITEYLTLPIGILLFILSILLWKISSKHYQSSGS